MQPVFAYFDPGTGSLLVQALVGGTAGFLVFGKYLWMSLTMGFYGPKHEVAQIESRPLSAHEIVVNAVSSQS